MYDLDTEPPIDHNGDRLHLTMEDFDLSSMTSHEIHKLTLAAEPACPWCDGLGEYETTEVDEIEYARTGRIEGFSGMTPCAECMGI